MQQSLYIDACLILEIYIYCDIMLTRRALKVNAVISNMFRWYLHEYFVWFYQGYFCQFLTFVCVHVVVCIEFGWNYAITNCKTLICKKIYFYWLLLEIFSLFALFLQYISLSIFVYYVNVKLPLQLFDKVTQDQ